jgi:hypothetical protein
MDKAVEAARDTHKDLDGFTDVEIEAAIRAAVEELLPGEQEFYTKERASDIERKIGHNACLAEIRNRLGSE